MVYQQLFWVVVFSGFWLMPFAAKTASAVLIVSVEGNWSRVRIHAISAKKQKGYVEILPKGLIPSLSLLTWVEKCSVGTAPYYGIGSVVCAQNPVRGVRRSNCLRRRYWITISKRNFWDWKHFILQGMLANVTPSLPFGASSWRAVPVMIDLVRRLQQFYRKNFIIT